ncbi:hypothetical protein DSO57_1005939 [Entomophthora muscae]|uniref:Uncharacterized protein n=1 Tax=Entomophthora muscae TaxID=34485 RepID=A0ACC2RYS0_9FUNG|nr:hypothetical protein DSO57_1005939 [Entomophthora muscae]
MESNLIDVFQAVDPVWEMDAIMFLLVLVGATINTVLLYVARMCRVAAQAIDVMLIQIIAIFDMLICLFMMFSIVLRYMVGNTILAYNGWWCHMSAIFFSGSLIVTLVFTALLALVRYLAIVRGIEIKHKLMFVLVYFLLAFIFVLFFALTVSYDIVTPSSGLYCTPLFSGPNVGARIGGYVSLTLLFFSYITIPTSYLGVILHYKKIISNIDEGYSFWRIQRSTYSLLLVIICYTVTTMPKFILVAITTLDGPKRSSVADGISILLLTSTTIINALFSLLMHNNLYRRLLHILGISSHSSEHLLL